MVSVVSTEFSDRCRWTPIDVAPPGRSSRPVGVARPSPQRRDPDRAGRVAGGDSLGAVSIKVELEDLPRVLADFDAGYLLTVDALGVPARVKVVSVRPALVDGTLIVTGPGRGSLANVRANAAVTLVWPPSRPGGMSLIVDGGAQCDGDDVRVTPTSGVLHKAA